MHESRMLKSWTRNKFSSASMKAYDRTERAWVNVIFKGRAAFRTAAENRVKNVRVRARVPPLPFTKHRHSDMWRGEPIDTEPNQTLNRISYARNWVTPYPCGRRCNSRRPLIRTFSFSEWIRNWLTFDNIFLNIPTGIKLREWKI